MKNRHLIRKFLSISLIALTFGGIAQATTIDFESGSVGNSIGTDYSALGATFLNGYYRQCGGGCPDPSFGIFAASNNFISPFQVNFTSLQPSVSFINVSSSSVTATAYDTGGSALSSVTDIQGYPITGVTDTLTGPGISYVIFASDGGGFGIDDLSFSASGVPEPAAWAMMLIGIGGVGVALRGSRRKSLAATVA